MLTWELGTCVGWACDRHLRASQACVFSSRSGSRDIIGRGKHGAGYLPPRPHHLLTAGRSLHLHHQVGGFGAGWRLSSTQPPVPWGLGISHL